MWKFKSVTLFTEGVDWNFFISFSYCSDSGHPLHRGCGLKFDNGKAELSTVNVTLFTEGVDWNKGRLELPSHINGHPLHRGCGLKFCGFWHFKNLPWSPSSQRVWIEIVSRCHKHIIMTVTLFTEGVDWNSISALLMMSRKGHPLHRGCGLKLPHCYNMVKQLQSPSSQRVWIEIAFGAFADSGAFVTLFTEGVDWNS